MAHIGRGDDFDIISDALSFASGLGVVCSALFVAFGLAWFIFELLLGIIGR